LLFDADTRAFGCIDGASLRGVYDNMTTALDRGARAIDRDQGRPVACARMFA
jgi:hypothetical protein